MGTLPIEQINHSNVVKELRKVGQFIEMDVKNILDVKPELEESEWIIKAREVKLKIDCLLHSALKIELKALYEEALPVLSELKKL